MYRIWTYWHQGVDKAPDIAHQCIRQLKALHPKAEIHLLDQYNVYDYGDSVPVKQKVWRKMSLPHRSDLLRTQLLIKHGGVWLDPTVYCRFPLQDWLPEYMNNGLFLFHRPGKDRIIANWFIAAEKDNYLLKQIYQSLIDYWNQHSFRNSGSKNGSRLEYLLKRIINGRSLLLSQLWLTPLFTKVLRIYPYMIYHHMFYYLIRTDPKCRKIYEDMPKFSADLPHLMQREGLLAPLTPKAQDAIDIRHTPVFKLNWKLRNAGIPTGSNLAYLFDHK